LEIPAGGATLEFAEKCCSDVRKGTELRLALLKVRLKVLMSSYEL